MSPPTISTPMDGKRSRSCSNAGRAASLVASHDRALLERVDRIVELTPVGVTVFGGAWSSLRRSARCRPRPRRSRPRSRVGRAARYRTLDPEGAREEGAPRQGRPRLARSGHPGKIFMGRAKADRGTAAARESRLADRLLGDRTDALEEAARQSRNPDAACDRPAAKPICPAAANCIAFKDVMMAFGGRALFGPLSFDVARTRADRDPRRQRLRQDHAVPPDHRRTRALRAATSTAAPTASPCSTSMSACSIRLEHSRQSPPPQSGAHRATRPMPPWRGLPSATARRCRSPARCRRRAAARGNGLRVRATSTAIPAAAGRADQPSRYRVDRGTGKLRLKDSTAR